MHIENCNSTVDNFHAIKRKDISDGSATTYIYLTKLSCLIEYIVFLKNSSETSDILCIGII